MASKQRVDSKTVGEWIDHWKDEFDAAFLYRKLSALEEDPKKKGIFDRLAVVEDKHVEAWGDLIERNGKKTPKPRPTSRAKLMAWIARRFSKDLIVNLMLREEGSEVRGYLALHRETTHEDTKDTALALAHESAEHAETLGEIATSGEGEPWHRTGSGGFLRNVIYGFNDGLTANFGLVAGVLAATSQSQVRAAVLIAGVAGSVADALSMGASGFLAAKSEQEVYAHEIAMEKQEIELMPELEEEELALIYEAKGLDPAQARRVAADVMSDPVRALEEKVREELKIGEAHATPFREGWITGTATAIGAFIPVFPFLPLEGAVAVWTAFSVAMVSHFAVGAARSFFTGRGIIRSGFDMFVVGMGVAGVGYLIGKLIEPLL